MLRSIGLRQRLLQGKKTVRGALIAATAALVLATTANPAMADVIVPPGGAGHVCSNYDRTNPEFVWQACAWADNNEVYFTIHWVNNTGTVYFAQLRLSYFHNGWGFNCFDDAEDDLVSVIGPGAGHTATARCVKPRVTGAYQAQGKVSNINFPATVRMSDSLQVQ